MQAELAAPPEHVVSGACPLDATQVAKLRLEHLRRDLGAKLAFEQLVGARAVGTCQPSHELRRQRRMTQGQRVDEALEGRLDLVLVRRVGAERGAQVAT